MPACLALESLSIPTQSPTISRIRVTSNAIATMLIRDRSGRCTRLPTIILFIMRRSLVVGAWQSQLGLCWECNKARTAGAQGRWLTANVLSWIASVGPVRLAGRLAQVHQLGACRHLQVELVIGHRLVQVQFQDVQRDVVFLLWPLDLRLGGEADAVVVLVLAVAHIRGELSVLIVDQLPMGLEVGSAEYYFSRKKPALLAASHHDDLVTRLLHTVPSRIDYRLVSVLEHRDFARGVDLLDQQRFIEVLRAKVFERLLGVYRLGVVAPRYETILGRNPELELPAVAHHVERAIAHDG